MAAASTAAATTAAISATGVSTEIGRVNMATKEGAPTIRTVAPNLKRLSRNTLVRPLAFRNHTSKLIRCGAIGADKLTQVEMSIPHTPTEQRNSHFQEPRSPKGDRQKTKSLPSSTRCGASRKPTGRTGQN